MQPLSRTIIDRYIGHYLKHEIPADNLKLQLSDGAGSVEGLLLNTEVCAFMFLLPSSFFSVLLAPRRAFERARH